MMAGRMFGDYGPPVGQPHSSSRIVPPPQAFDLQSSLDRIRAAQARAAANQQAAEEDEAATQAANMQMRDDSENWMNVQAGYEPWRGGMAHQSVDGSVPQLGPESMRAPGALTQQQMAEEFQRRVAFRQQNEASARQVSGDREAAAEADASAQREADDTWMNAEMDAQVNQDWDRMAEEGLGLMRSQEIIPDNRDVEKKERRLANTVLDTEKIKLRASDARIHTPVVSEASPDDAPLPGEETLPPAIARWNQERAMLGGGGLSRLHRAYMREVPEGTRGMMTFEKWLDSKGVDAETDYNEARATMNQLADSRQDVRFSKDGRKVVTNVALNTDVADRKKQQYLDTMAKRYRQDIAAGRTSMAEIEKAYDDGVRRGTTDNEGNQMNRPHLAGARGANSLVINNLKRNKAAQIGVNWDNRRDQMARAQQFRMPLGQIMFFDSLQNAKDNKEMANILMLGHQSQPHMGWDKMAFMLMKGDMDMKAAQNWAAGQGGKPPAANQLQGQLNDLYNGPVNPATIQAARFVAGNTMQEGWDAKRKEEHERQTLQPFATRIANSEKPTQEEVVALQQMTQGMSPEEFYRYCRLNPDDPKSQAVYKTVFGKAPPTPFSGTTIGQLFTGVGNAVSGAAGIVGDILTGQVNPGTEAWANQGGGGKARPKPQDGAAKPRRPFDASV